MREEPGPGPIDLGILELLRISIRVAVLDDHPGETARAEVVHRPDLREVGPEDLYSLGGKSLECMVEPEVYAAPDANVEIRRQPEIVGLARIVEVDATTNLPVEPDRKISIRRNASPKIQLLELVFLGAEKLPTQIGIDP